MLKKMVFQYTLLSGGLTDSFLNLDTFRMVFIVCVSNTKINVNMIIVLTRCHN